MLDIAGGKFRIFVSPVGFREILSKIYAKSHFVLWGPGLFICFAAESFARFGVCFRDGLEVDGRENFEFGENFVSLVCAVRLLWRLLGTVVLLSGMT